ncbi:hypothetical protein M427DRAFT_58842 [Gonapodya prolifera JEL478]|uniref:ER-bound oxygenase mpaB/mpaB'/Rubber oxygenase catalytic domain-containing protein n=1 Tax=Gonapodya prolifera (strain JEL478) TaxID=1344416 RepID=A0A139A918_GONPJ|nr:hypothetical protein M427DRAFT_58842 [Gonapodya prolifera JEL478]|eukprot:KXS13321.1 hypothetical protein M427DRAFT_58842 [Gonapodya prolifera JEL478]
MSLDCHASDIGAFWLGPDPHGVLARFPPAPMVTLDKMRLISDDVVDAYIAASGITIRDDAVERLKSDAKSGMPEAVALWEHLTTVPEWVDQDTIKRAQAFYWRNSDLLGILQLTTLVLGTSFAKIQKVLFSTGYLTAERSVFRRLIETSAWVNSMMFEDALLPEHQGWATTVKVRFLHGHVRTRIRKMAVKNPQVYDEKEYGVPINQEDMIHTILDFCSGPLMKMRAMGQLVTAQNTDDYLHMWRYVSYLSGVRDEFTPLTRGIDCCASFGYSFCLHNCVMTTTDETPRKLAQVLLRGMARGVAELRALEHTQAAKEPTSEAAKSRLLEDPKTQASVQRVQTFAHGVLTDIAIRLIGPQCTAYLALRRPTFGQRVAASLLIGWWWVASRISYYAPWLGSLIASVNRSRMARIESMTGVRMHKFDMKYEPK